MFARRGRLPYLCLPACLHRHHSKPPFLVVASSSSFSASLTGRLNAIGTDWSAYGLISLGVAFVVYGGAGLPNARLSDSILSSLLRLEEMYTSLGLFLCVDI